MIANTVDWSLSSISWCVIMSSWFTIFGLHCLLWIINVDFFFFMNPPDLMCNTNHMSKLAVGTNSVYSCYSFGLTNLIGYWTETGFLFNYFFSTMDSSPVFCWATYRDMVQNPICMFSVVVGKTQKHKNDIILTAGIWTSDLVCSD